jgi:hypothetical protein
MKILNPLSSLNVFRKNIALLFAFIIFSISMIGKDKNRNQPTCTASITVMPGNSTICAGASITLTASGGVSYSWNDGEVTAAITVSPLATTAFIVTGTDGSGCTGTDTIVITVDNPDISASSSQNLICAGASTNLSTSIDGGSLPFTYVWTPSSWLTCSNCSSPTANPPGTINYNVVATDANGCSSSTSITVNVDNMNVNENVNPITPCSGSTVALSASVLGGTIPFTYLWSPGSGSSNTYSFSAPPAPTSYSLTVTDSKGCSASTSALVAPDNFNVYLQPRTTICANLGGSPAGAPSGLYAQALGGAPPFTYTWSTGNTNPLLPFVGLSSGIYSVTVKDGNNCTVTAVDTLTVNPTPTITITSSTNPIQIGWVDTLTASGGSGYIWSSGATTNRIIVNPKTSADYSVTGWNVYGCSSSVGTTVIVTRDYFLPSPDSTMPHKAGFPPIYYDGNIAIGGDSAYSPHHSLEVHGSATIDTNLTVKGTVNAGSIVTNRITLNDTMIALAIRTHRIGLFPGDSIIHLGDSSIAFNMTTNNMYGTYGSNYGGVAMGYGNNVSGRTLNWGTPPSAAVGYLNILNRVLGSIAIGSSNQVTVNSALTFGFGLTNNITGSILMGGYTSAGGIPAISIIPDYFHHTSGFVGIGTPTSSTPDAQLNISIPASATANAFSVSSSPGSDYIVVNSSGQLLIESPASTFTTVPGSYGLYVGNGILASLVKIASPTGSDWFDYVFGNNYKLKSIAEVARYIKENKHLPDVPSAADVKENGIDVAEMDGTLLKKIEELTLYIIQQQQQIKDLQDKVDKLSKENK